MIIIMIVKLFPHNNLKNADQPIITVKARPVQTGNVWRPNIIKHCLVTKHADVKVSGQTVY